MMIDETDIETDLVDLVGILMKSIEVGILMKSIELYILDMQNAIRSGQPIPTMPYEVQRAGAYIWQTSVSSFEDQYINMANING